MSNPRKVQMEVDKLLKKVQEGMEIYDDVWEKVYSAPSQVQKERFEAQLKKEIKKLQRLRDDIKSLTASPEVKDKKGLDASRKSIESKMESFKHVERETKTKAYSKEGLAQGTRTDPADVAKAHTQQWINKAISSLQEQCEQIEADIEAETATKKGKRNTHSSDLEERLQMHQFHIQKLEVMLRLLDNEEVSPDELDVVEDDVNYYVDSNTDPSFIDNDELYDQLDLPDDPSIGTLGLRHASKADVDSEDEDEKLRRKSVESDGKRTPPMVTTKAATTPAAAAPAKAVAAKKEPPAPAPKKAKEVSTPKAAPTVPIAKAAVAPSSPIVPNPTRPEETMSSKLMARQKEQQAKEQAAREAIAKEQTRQKQQQQQQQQQQQAAITVDDAIGLLDEDADALNDDTFGDVAVTSGGAAPGTLEDIASISAKNELSGQPTGGSVWDKNRTSAARQAQPQPQQAPPQQPQLGTGRLQPIGPAAAAASPSNPPSAPTGAYSAPQPAGKNAPNLNNAEARNNYLRMMGMSYNNLPHPKDSERPKGYVPPNPYKTPEYYPQTVHPAFTSREIFHKFDCDTLFFIFYYQQTTYQQYLAALELKRQSWRYHKKFLTWFQRHDKPKVSTEEYEQGTYVYFDYECGWYQRLKNDFVFKYVYLEDELVA